MCRMRKQVYGGEATKFYHKIKIRDILFANVNFKWNLENFEPKQLEFVNCSEISNCTKIVWQKIVERTNQQQFA